MAENSKIQWTDHTWNGWWGCVKVSAGCQHCYAETFANRTGRNIWGPAKTTERWRTKAPWTDILKWDKQAKADGVRRRVFAESMSDFFEDHPQLVPWREEAYGIFERLEWLDLQLLTKRIENVPDMVPAHWMNQWPQHIWMGTSVENQEMAYKRIPELLKVPAAIRFLSVEPLLGPVDLGDYLYFCPDCDDFLGSPGKPSRCNRDDCRNSYINRGIHWIIVGGESGPGARRMDLDWARNLIDHCEEAKVPAFMKQLGSIQAKELGLKHGKGGDIDEWPEDLCVREFPKHPLFVDIAKDLDAQWPQMPDLADGIDVFAEKYGLPSGKGS